MHATHKENMVYIDNCDFELEIMDQVDIAIKMYCQDSCRLPLPNKRVMTSKDYFSLYD